MSRHHSGRSRFQAISTTIVLFPLLVFLPAVPTSAEIYRWDTGELIVEQDALPGVVFGQIDLSFAEFSRTDLSGSDFGESVLIAARFHDTNASEGNFRLADLTFASFAGADLTGARFQEATLSTADFSGAIIRGAIFADPRESGLLAEQVYATASYQEGNLQGINFRNNNLSGWDFSSKKLEDASFYGTNLSGLDFSEADLTNASFWRSNVSGVDFSEGHLEGAWFRNANLSGVTFAGADLTETSFRDASFANVDFSDAIIRGADFIRAVQGGFTAEHLYSTASYKTADLSGVRLEQTDLRGWNFSGQNLEKAQFDWCDLADVDFSGATISRASFGYAANFSAEQFYSTASYELGELQGINLMNNPMDGWDFVGKDLSDAGFWRASLLQATFVGSNLTEAHFWKAKLNAADFSSANLRLADFEEAVLADANLTNANLTLATFEGATLTGANFTDSTITSARLRNAVSRGFTAAKFYSTASYKDGNLKGLNLAKNDLSGWNFAGKNLDGANFVDSDLGSAEFDGASLYHADFGRADLKDANLANANLSHVRFGGADLDNTDLSNATIVGASFGDTLSAEQLYSTASYKNGDLRRVSFSFGENNKVSNWDFRRRSLAESRFSGEEIERFDFSDADLTRADFGYVKMANPKFVGANLTRASFRYAYLAGADFRNANLAEVDFDAYDLHGANFTDAKLDRTNLDYATQRGFTAEDLYSTASYQEGTLAGSSLMYNDLREWNFAGKDLSDVRFYQSRLAGADFSGATIKGTNLGNTTDSGFSIEQLCSTRDYQAGTLRDTYLGFNDLRNCDFRGKTIQNVEFQGSDLSGADFSGSTLSGAGLSGATLIDVDFTDATIRGSSFSADEDGLTAEQFYSTASYKSGDLHGIGLGGDLRGWDFSGKDLSNARISGSLQEADFTGAIIRGFNMAGRINGRREEGDFSAEQLYSTASYRDGDLTGIQLAGNHDGWNFAGMNLTNANFRGASVVGADFTGAIINGADLRLSLDQLYSTASYTSGDLTNTDLGSFNLNDANLAGKNFTGAILSHAMLEGADLSGAIVRDANFYKTAERGFSAEQFYSTQSYQDRDLQGIVLRGNDLNGWSFSGQNLSNASFRGSTLVGADFTNTIVNGASFSVNETEGLIAEQLYSTASYKQGNLRRIDLGSNDLSGWNFTGMDLTGADFGSSDLTGADFSGAILHGANLSTATLPLNLPMLPVVDWARVTIDDAAFMTDRIVINDKGTLTLTHRMSLTSDIANHGHLIAEDGLDLVDVTLSLGSTGTIEVLGDLVLQDQSGLTIDVGGELGGNIFAYGAAHLTGGSTLQLIALERLPSVGSTSRTLLDATRIDGTFSEQPAIGDHLGHGVFLEEIRQSGRALDVDLFQAAYGDMDGNGKVNALDLFDMKNSPRGFGTGATDAQWTDGDMVGNGLDTPANGIVDIWDIFAIKQTGLFAKGPYATGVESAVGTTSVPEPATWILLLWATLGWLLKRRIHK